MRTKLTLLDAEVSHHEDHGVPGEDVIAAIDMFAVDGEAAAREEGDDPVDDQQCGDVPRLLRAEIVLVRLGQHRHEDRDGPVEVEETK